MPVDPSPPLKTASGSFVYNKWLNPSVGRTTDNDVFWRRTGGRASSRSQSVDELHGACVNERPCHVL